MENGGKEKYSKRQREQEQESKRLTRRTFSGGEEEREPGSACLIHSSVAA